MSTKGITILSSPAVSPFVTPVRIPPNEKENKVSSGAEDDAKSVEVGTRKAGHWSDLSGGQSSA